MNRNLTLSLVFLLAFTLRVAAAGMLYENTFASRNNMAGWAGDVVIEGGGATLYSAERSRSLHSIKKELKPALLAGKVIRISCEAKGEGILDSNQVSPFHGAKVQLAMRRGDQGYWEDIPFPDANFDWKKLEMTFAVPRGIDSAIMNIGFQQSGGRLTVKNLKIESIGECVDIASVGNMRFTDDRAGDGRGGWTDQGPAQDGRSFIPKLKTRSYAGIPFYIDTEGTGLLVMNHARLASGPESVQVPVAKVEASRLYLMHAVAWSSPQLQGVGTIVITGENGKTQDIPVRLDRDVGEWFRNVVDKQNAFPAVTTRMPGGEEAGVYISKFQVDAKIGKIARITFRTGKGSMWMILGATLVDKDYSLPSRKPITMKADDNWLPVAGDVQAPVLPGSALDLSGIMPMGEVGSQGRVIINSQGHFAFENTPDKNIRFLTCTLSPHPNSDVDFETHESIERLVDGIWRTGYNMVRIHFLERFLMKGMGREGEFSETTLDRFDYFIHCLKRRGIYLNLDLMTSWIGYTPGDIQTKENKNPLIAYKARIHFEPEIRENWKRGVTMLFGRKNTYTGTRLVDDPVLVMAIAYNEQEYGFWRDFDTTYILPRWHEFLRSRYSSIDQLKQAWGAKAEGISSFEDVPCFRFVSRLPDTLDAALFLREVETNTAQWYEKTMREIGYLGPVVSYNCGKNMYYNVVRKDMPVVAMNAYHAHPSNWILPGSGISQKSSIEERFKIIRDFMGVRQRGKPFVVTEHGLVFWNQYRYEQAFTMGAYAALQGIDGLTTHGSPVRYKDSGRILSFENSADPIAKVSEFLTYFLFVRGDVATAAAQIHVQITAEDVFKENGLMGGLPTDVSLSALIARIDVECVDDYTTKTAGADSKIYIRLSDTTPVLVSDAGFSQTLDTPDGTAEKMLGALRSAKIIGPSNRSDGKSVFESTTGEILADTAKRFIQVNAPRFQGICAEAGSEARLSDFTIESMSHRGVLAVVSLDGVRSIKEADRLMLVYATNALNTGMQFTNHAMTTLVQVGDNPPLLARGKFSVTVDNKNAVALRLYPLDFAGNRLGAIKPSKVDGTKVSFEVDTAKDGAAVFFELQAASS
jgi:hypothetical protein